MAPALVLVLEWLVPALVLLVLVLVLVQALPWLVLAQALPWLVMVLVSLLLGLELPVLELETLVVVVKKAVV